VSGDTFERKAKSESLVQLWR